MKKSRIMTTLLSICLLQGSVAAYAQSFIASQRPGDIEAQRAGNVFNSVCQFMKKQQTAVEKHITETYAQDATQYQENAAMFDSQLLTQLVAGPVSVYTIQKQADGSPEIYYTFGAGGVFRYMDGVSVQSSALINAENHIVGWVCVTNLRPQAYSFVTCHCQYNSNW